MFGYRQKKEESRCKSDLDYYGMIMTENNIMKQLKSKVARYQMDSPSGPRLAMHSGTSPTLFLSPLLFKGKKQSSWSLLLRQWSTAPFRDMIIIFFSINQTP